METFTDEEIEKLFGEEAFLKKKPVMLDFISHRLDVYNNRKLAALGITSSQAKILLRIYHAQDMEIAQSELKRFGRCGSTITSLLANLEKGGFISREASDDDARAKYVYFTETGLIAAQAALYNIYDMEEMIDKTLTKKEAKTLNLLLEKVAKAFSENPDIDNEDTFERIDNT